MRRVLGLATLALVLGTALALLFGDAAQGDGYGRGKWVKFLFSPQAGLNSACLNCGWHGACVGPTPAPGPALDYGTCSDSRDHVYLRVFGFLPPGSPMTYVGYASYYAPPGTLCKEIDARIRDTSANLLETMRYVHTENPYPQMVYMYADGSANGYLNEQPFAHMASDENQGCKNQNLWSGQHLHETHDDTGGNSIIFLRDDGDCGGRYPCAPTPYPDHLYYNPQDLGDSWARIFCFDDTDCDGWTDGEETHVGTDSWDQCPDNANDAAWPPDMDSNGSISILDVLKFKGKLGKSWGNPGYDQRYDLNGDSSVSILDVLLYKPLLGQSCTN
jgi:hypothetical protein